MKTVRIFDIDWETDGEDVIGLPFELKVPLPEKYVDVNHILDYLSDTFGWLVNDMKFEECTDEQF